MNEIANCANEPNWSDQTNDSRVRLANREFARTNPISFSANPPNEPPGFGFAVCIGHGECAEPALTEIGANEPNFLDGKMRERTQFRRRRSVTNSTTCRVFCANEPNFVPHGVVLPGREACQKGSPSSRFLEQPNLGRTSISSSDSWRMEMTPIIFPWRLPSLASLTRVLISFLADAVVRLARPSDRGYSRPSFLR